VLRNGDDEVAMNMFRGLAMALLLGASAVAHGQGYPSKSITMIIPFAAGGPTDTVARTIATAMQRRLRQTIIIENATGAGGTIAAARVAEAPADGYTVLLHHIGMAISPSLYPNLSFDPQTSFDPIGEVTDVPMTLIGRNDFPHKNFKELLHYLKAHQKQVIYGNASPGSASHLCGLMFMSAIGMELKSAGFKGTGPAMNDLLAGKVDLICDQSTNSAAQIRGGKVIGYGISTPARVSALPNLPTLQEGGLKGFELSVWHARYVPRNTPKEAIDKLNDALRYALTDAAVKARFNDLGTEPVSLDKVSPEYARAHLAAEIKKWAPIIKKDRKYAD
jgi:tripartite-type tricarboxylate transporter receptor subunit TctC